MPPEQVNGDVKAMGPGCDIYSLGVVLYQLLTGRLPFDPASGLGALMGQIVCDPPPPPSRFRADLSPELEAICLKTLAKKAEDRPRSMAELAKALESFLRGQGGGARPGGDDPAKLVFAQMLATDTDVAPRPAGVSRPVRRPRWPWLAGIGLGAAILLAALLAFLLRGPRDGTVVIELSQPGAGVDVRVDGHRVDLGHPLVLNAGKHQLTVQGPAIETVAESFTVHPGRAIRLPVTLKPRQLISASRPVAPPEQRIGAEEPALTNPVAPTPAKAPPEQADPKLVAKPPPAPKRAEPSLLLPIPPDAEAQRAREGIRQQYAALYTRQDRAERLALAERLRGQADETLDNPTRRYALWQEARQLAIQAAAIVPALRISDDMAHTFVLDGLELKVGALRDINGRLTTPGPAYPASERPELNHHLAARALEVLDGACAARKFETAFDLLEMCNAAESRARYDGDVVLIPPAPAELEALKPQFARLQRDPEDGSASFQVGRFLCLSEGRWQAGLPLLAKANDPLWQAAARSELKRPGDAAAHIATGDTWKRLFDRERGRDHGRLGWHARSWYDLALSELPPVERRAVVTRALQIGGAPNLSRVKPFFDADTADLGSGLPTHKSEPRYEWDSGYAHGRWFMRTTAGDWHGVFITRFAAPFACQVIARVVDPPSAAWELFLANPEQKHEYKVRVDGTGAVRLLFWDDKTKVESILAAPGPPGVKPQSGFRTLLVVARASQLDLYLDGVPLLNTAVRLPRDVGPGQIQFGVVSGNAGGAHMEVQRLTIWPADGVPHLGARP
jgi:hypothetical protein